MWTRRRRHQQHHWQLIVCAVLLTHHQYSSVSCTENCWEGVNPSNCIINAKFHNINTYDVHIQCTVEDEGRDSGDRFGKVHYAELNGCVTYKHTNPFLLLPNMNNLKKLTLAEFFVGELHLNDKNGPYLPKLQELIMKDNVIRSYASEFFAAQTIRQLKNIQFAGPRTLTPLLDEFKGTQLQSITIREGNVLIDYDVIGQLANLNTCEIYSCNVTINSYNSVNNSSNINSFTLEDSLVINRTIPSVFEKFPQLNYLKIRNSTSTIDEFVSLDLKSILNLNPRLSSLIVQKQNLSKLIVDLPSLTVSQLRTLDITYNDLSMINWTWDPNLVSKLIHTTKLKLLIDHNPWKCEFFQSVEEELFEYEKDYNAINVRGIKCKYNATRGGGSPHSNRPLDLNNMWLLYGCVLSSLLLIISVTYLVCAMCRSKRREPFYRSLAKWKSPTRTVQDLTMRKLPATTYETPLQYRTIEFKSEDNCEIYEEIPAHATGQTLQVII